MAYNSAFARRLQQRLQAAELTDEAYLRNYDEADRFRRDFQSNPRNASAPEQSAACKMHEFTHLRRTVSADIMAGMAMQQDRDFQTIMKATAQTEASPEAVVTKYEAYLGFLSAMEAIQTTRTRTSASSTRSTPMRRSAARRRRSRRRSRP